MAKVLILGGTGLISTGITQHLIRQGHEIAHFNRGLTGGPQFQGKVRQIVGDRHDYSRFEARIKEEKAFDCVIDVICFGKEDAESSIRAFSGRTQQYIHCSSIDVYQRPASRYPLVENEPQKVNNEYGRGKIEAESTFLEAHRQGAFAVTILRPSLTYGEGRGFFFATGSETDFLDRLAKGKPVIAPGDGSGLLTLCHRDDVGLGFANALGNPRAYGRCYQVTAEEAHTWNQYIEIIAAALGAPQPKIVHIPTDLLSRLVPDPWGMLLATNFQFNNIYDLTAAKRDLGFRYTIPFKEGAGRVVAWLKANNRIEDCAKYPLCDRIIKLWERHTAEFLRDFEREEN